MFTYFRINKAIELMSDENAEYSLTQLALEVGFGSLQHFSKVFKNTMNISLTKLFSHPPLCRFVYPLKKPKFPCNNFSFS